MEPTTSMEVIDLVGSPAPEVQPAAPSVAALAGSREATIIPRAGAEASLSGTWHPVVGVEGTRDLAPESKTQDAWALYRPDPLMARLLPTLRWFEEGKPDAPMFMLDDLSEHAQWEWVQDGAERAAALLRR